MNARLWLTITFAALHFSACSSDPGVVDDNGNDEQDTPDTDDGPVVEDGSVKLGASCLDSRECESGLCVVLGQGIDESLCSQRCATEDDCQETPGERWDCLNVDSSTEDVILVCVPEGLCLDKDGDGYGIGPNCLGRDCDDNDNQVYFGAPELCDGKDNDCNGVVDDNVIHDVPTCNTGATGACAIGAPRCVNAALECEAVVRPGQLQEICNGIDDDCDGIVDEGPGEDGNENAIAGVGNRCSDGNAACETGIRICDPNRGVICQIDGDLLDNTCDGVDDDCNGLVDDDVANLRVACAVGKGVCLQLGITTCDPGNPAAPTICNAQPDLSRQGPEICDYLDNDCNGVVDGPFRSAEGIYNTVAHCAACNRNCANLWTPTPAAFNIIPTCAVAGGGASCSYICEMGWFDADGNASNGCELKPDVDAVYVSTLAKGGEDFARCGSWETPCATIQYGLRIAKERNRKRVYVSEGIYRQGVTLENGIDLLGGYNSVNWTRATRDNTTMILGSVTTTGASVNDRHAVEALNITSATELSGFTIISEDGQTGGHSIGIYVSGSTNKLVIRDNDIRAGLGGQGSSGTAGTDANSGERGYAGASGKNVTGACTAATHVVAGGGGTTSCLTPGTTTQTPVSGGRGADAICPVYGGPGQAPVAGVGTNGGTAGTTAYGRGFLGNNCIPRPDSVDKSFPLDGGPGRDGTNGQGGIGATASPGSVASGRWSGNSGQAGKHGTSGSGGGGGGASHGTLVCTGSDSNGFTGCTTVAELGASGGGGGAGGCGAAAATGGTSGGASFGIFVAATAANQMPTITGNILTRNFGGLGGSGGIGGNGGNGGNGGSGGQARAGGIYCPQAGRRGGDGGRGGAGGGGGGGAGGNSFDIAIYGATANDATLKANNTFVNATTATSGTGGPGGGSMGFAGATGAAGLSGTVAIH